MMFHKDLSLKEWRKMGIFIIEMMENSLYIKP